MKYVSFLAFALLLTACDVPSGNRRQIFNTPNSNAVNAPTGSLSPAPGPAPSPSGGSVPSPTSPTSGTGFEACSLTPKGSTSSLGSVGVCQSTADEKQVKFQTSVTDMTVRTCLIPTFKDTSGASVPVGQPQCTYTEAGKVYQGTLYKTRSGFEKSPLNGVMVMRESLLTSYFQCMDAYTVYSQSKCGSDPYYVQCYNQNRYYYPNAAQMCCDQLAKNHQASICNAFKSQYGSQYLDIRLKY